MPLSYAVVAKGSFRPPILWGGTPQILNRHFQITLTFEHLADFGCVPFSKLGSWQKR